MTRIVVSEKTLELNISSELLANIRALPGCASAFWIGMKQNQEVRNGIDELIANVPAGLHLALQFKAPRPTPPNAIPYQFTFNDRQHRHLVRLAGHRPDAVFYVLPHLNTFTRVRATAPQLLAQTTLVDVAQLSTLPASTRVDGTHKVESWQTHVVVHSDPVTVEHAPTMERLRVVLASGQLRSTLIPQTELRTWLRQLFDLENGNPHAIGQRLRGFNTVCIA